ncbi:MAG: 50S ribosomal protein L18 [Patescibacteria group bacterium]
MQTKKEKRIRRHKKIRFKIKGSKDRLRLCVFRSINHIYAQVIDDKNAKIIVSASDKELKGVKANKTEKTMTHKVGIAHEVGRLIAKKAIENKIEKVVFDRAGILFHGRIKALADGAREGGLKF